MQKLPTIFQQKYWHICHINDQSFNNLLTNNIVSFEQLGPDRYFSCFSQKQKCYCSHWNHLDRKIRKKYFFKRVVKEMYLVIILGYFSPVLHKNVGNECHNKCCFFVVVFVKWKKNSRTISRYSALAIHSFLIKTKTKQIKTYLEWSWLSNHERSATSVTRFY